MAPLTLPHFLDGSALEIRYFRSPLLLTLSSELDRCQVVERAVRSLRIVQLDDVTPIASIPARCAIGGIPGTVSRCGFIDSPSATGSRFFTVVLTRVPTKWDRSALNSAKRRHRQLERAAVERTDERLRIVSDELWGRVKARQKRRTLEVGVKVKTGLRRHVRPTKYLLSGLLRCAACEASFVISGGGRRYGYRYQCASHVNGGKDACSVSLSVPRERVEGAIIECVYTDLLKPGRLLELEKRFDSATAIRVDHSARIAELEKQEHRLAAAIAEGGDMAALVGALKKVQAEREGLHRAAAAPRPAAKQRTETVEQRIERMQARLAEGGEVARAALAELFPTAIRLTPDVSGWYLWAMFEADIAPLVTQAERFAECGFEDLDAVETPALVGVCGSGGRI